MSCSGIIECETLALVVSCWTVQSGYFIATGTQVNHQFTAMVLQVIE